MSDPIVIAGGGIGGLTLAALLARRGTDCLVLERAPRFAPIGAGIVLQPNAIKALRRAGLGDAVERGAPAERLEIRDDRGRVLSSVETASFIDAFGAGVSGFHRATLHAALLSRVPEDRIRLGSPVRRYESSDAGIVVELENGDRVRGAALVGADGLRSATRRQLLDDGDPLYAGYTSWRGITRRDPHWPAGRVCESWGRGARFGLVAIDDGLLYWFATANTSEGGSTASRDELVRRFGSWHDPIPAVIASTPDTAIHRTDIHDRPPVAGWTSGRVTLLGDAAHPMTPNLGQGGCQAIEDAIVLDRCLSQESDAATAFRKYETARLARTARVVKEARRFGALGQIENGAMCAVRDFAMRVAPASAGIRSVAWLYSYEA